MKRREHVDPQVDSMFAPFVPSVKEDKIQSPERPPVWALPPRHVPSSVAQKPKAEGIPLQPQPPTTPPPPQLLRKLQQCGQNQKRQPSAAKNPVILIAKKLKAKKQQ